MSTDPRSSCPAAAAGHDFETDLRDALARAPWIAASVAAHALLFLLLAQLPWSLARPDDHVVTIVSEAEHEIADPFERVEPEPPVETPIDPVERQIDDPVVIETPVESEDVSEHEFDEPLFASPFEARGANDVIGVGPASGGGDGPGGRRRSGRDSGPASQQAVEWGLDWLARHQDPRGFWSCQGFSSMCVQNNCDGEGDPQHDVGVTGLALLAYLGSGHTTRQGRHKEVVRKGIKYLLDAQDRETGCFGEVNSHQQFLYDHSLATLAVTEAYGLSRWPLLKEPAQRGVDFILAARNPYKAWRYAYPPDGGNDVSVTGWMIMCLKSAQDFGLYVDGRALDDARAYLDEMTDGNTGRTGYVTRGGWSSREAGLADKWPEQKSEAMTAVALLCRVFLGEVPGESPALRGGADLLLKRLPLWDEKEGTIDFYYWYYGSYAMFQLAGADWDKWQSRMLDAVVGKQRKDGDERGSWDPQFDPWGHRGGRVYSTAIMTLCLEVYYRYDRVLGAR